MVWTRARSDEQKQQRINEILDATARLFQEMNYEDISFAMIAKEANFTRSNLYKYFTTKEEVFLYLLHNDTNQWVNDIIGKLTNITCSIDEFAHIWVSTIINRKRLLKLMPLSATILEKHCSDEAIIYYKKSAMKNIALVIDKLKKIFSDFSEEQILNFLSYSVSLAMGLYPFVNSLSERQKKVIKDAGIQHLDIKFEEAYYDAIKTLLKGFS